MLIHCINCSATQLRSLTVSSRTKPWSSVFWLWRLQSLFFSSLLRGQKGMLTFKWDNTYLKIGFNPLHVHCQHKQSSSLIHFEKNLIFRVREGNMSAQKNLLNFVEVENSLLVLLPFSVANNINNSGCSHIWEFVCQTLYWIFHHEKTPIGCYSQSYRWGKWGLQGYLSHLRP